MDVQGKTIEIITGLYEQGTPEARQIVDGIWGKEQAQERFDLYFHWYNLLHELGHGIMAFNCPQRPHPVEEEQLVNDFAVGYWLHYGEAEKLEALGAVVSYALAHLTLPDGAGTSPTDYARAKWGTAALFTFNNYGWFQFSCVKESLQRGETLASVLPRMGIERPQVQPRRTLAYSLSNETILPIVRDAACMLRAWGAVLPEVTVALDPDPNRHLCNLI